MLKVLASTMLCVMIISSCSRRAKEIRPDSFTVGVMDSAAVAPDEAIEDEEGGPLPELDTSNVQYHYRVALQDGEIVRKDPASGISIVISNTGHKIDALFISPSGKYVAGQRRVRMVQEPVLEPDENTPNTPVYEIMVFNIPSGKCIRQFPAPTDEFTFFDHWISTSRFVFYSADGFAVSGYYAYDAFRDSIQTVRYGYGNKKHR